MEAMATAGASAAQRWIGIVHLHRNERAAKEGDQPADRATEALGPDAPAHEPTALQGIDPSWNHRL